MKHKNGGNMSTSVIGNNYFGTERIGKILLRIAPPVMLAQLIQSLYNIVDSFFVGKYSDNALTALTVVYPLQLIIVALAVGTGVGVNTYMARKYAQEREKEANGTAGAGLILALVSWAIFAAVSALIMRSYVMTSAKSPQAIEDAVIYGNIVCIGSLGAFLEGIWSKVHQSRGNMRLPMIAQVAGALTNIALDPLMIFGIGPFPEMGVAGAAYATVLGQVVSAVIVGVKGFRRPPAACDFPHYANRIYFYGYSSIIMQALYTVYIVGLNMILAKFSDSAVTILGLYYKMQGFFFIPLIGLETCIVPVLSFNYTRKEYRRCRDTMNVSFALSAVFMVIGIVCFCFFPRFLISIFSSNAEVYEIGNVAFRIIGTSFIPAVFSLMIPVFFQAIGGGKTSTLLVLIRQIFCLVPIFWLFSFIGLNYTWLSFPISESIAGSIGIVLYVRTLKKWKAEKDNVALLPAEKE